MNIPTSHSIRLEVCSRRTACARNRNRHPKWATLPFHRSEEEPGWMEMAGGPNGDAGNPE